MIINIGVDIIEIDRIKKACHNKKFFEKCFTQEEQIFCSKKIESCASNFAAKEAVSKVLGTGFKNFFLKDIEILRDYNGKPYVILYNNAKKISEELNIKKFHVSLSHNKSVVIAYVIGEGDTN